MRTVKIPSASLAVTPEPSTRRGSQIVLENCDALEKLRSVVSCVDCGEGVSACESVK